MMSLQSCITNRNTLTLLQIWHIDDGTPRRLYADTSMLCDGVLMSAGQVCWYLQRHVCMACEYAGGR